MYDILYDYYKNIEEKRTAYENSQTSNEAQTNLKLLIQRYLQIKDFIYAYKYIDEYIEKKYEGFDSLRKFKIEIDELLEKIKKAIQERSNKNVFVFVFDALSYETSKNAEFITKFAEESLSFQNVYAPTFHTRSSTVSIISGNKYLQDGTYKSYYINTNDSDFLLKLKSRGINIKHFAISSFSFLDKIVDSMCFCFPVQSLMNWELLVEVANESADCINFIHTFETHTPFYCGDSKEVFLPREIMQNYFYAVDEAPENFNEYARNLQNDALKYSDKQLEFCVSFLNAEKDSIIITSDHANWLDFIIDNKYNLIEKGFLNKIPLIIRSKSVKQGKHKELYSTIDLPNIIFQLISDNNDLIISFFDFSCIEIEPLYVNKSNIHNVIVPNTGIIALVSDNEVYNFCLDGTETYFLLPDTKTNLINDKCHAERINYFRKQIEIDTREEWKFMFKTYPHLMEFHKDRVDEFLNENKNPNRKI
jgi:hypothetical protein